MGLEGNFVEAKEVGPALVLDHVVADLVVVVHLKGKDGLLCSVNPVAVSEHCIEFPTKTFQLVMTLGGGCWIRKLLNQCAAEPLRMVEVYRTHNCPVQN